jgi:predicted ATPase
MSGICATGLKKCSPTKRPGASSAEESSSRRIDALSLGVLDDGFDDDIRLRDAGAFDVGAQASRGLCPLRGVLDALLEQRRRAFHRRLDVLLGAVLQRDLQSAQRAPGCDVAAHHAGTDDMHVLRRPRPGDAL